MGRIHVSSSLNLILIRTQIPTRSFVGWESRLAAHDRHQVPCLVERPKPHTHDRIGYMLKTSPRRIECVLQKIVQEDAALASVLSSEFPEPVNLSISELLSHRSAQASSIGVFLFLQTCQKDSALPVQPAPQGCVCSRKGSDFGWYLLSGFQSRCERVEDQS
jgi:hypothetical protein